MNRTTVWLLYSVGVLLGRMMPAPRPMSVAAAEIAITGAGLGLLLHWVFNRRWKRYWPPRGGL